MKNLFWLLFSALLAVVVHVAYLLFVPSQQFSAQIDTVLKNQGTNKFAILDTALQTKLMPFSSTGDLVGLCKYDVSKGPVKLSIQVPIGYWSFAVYTIRGRQVYALNGEQADTRNFSVTLSKAQGLLAQLMGDGSDDALTQVGELGWRVDVSDDQGLAFLWMPQSDPWLRREAAGLIGKSSCVAAGG